MNWTPRNILQEEFDKYWNGHCDESVYGIAFHWFKKGDRIGVQTGKRLERERIKFDLDHLHVKSANEILNEILSTIEPQYHPDPLQKYIATLCIEAGIMEVRKKLKELDNIETT